MQKNGSKSHFSAFLLVHLNIFAYLCRINKNRHKVWMKLLRNLECIL